MRNSLTTIAKYTGYALFTLLLFLYFIFLTFPYGEVKDRYLDQWTRGLPVRISVGEVQATPLLGLKASPLGIYGKLERSAGEVPSLDLDQVLLKPSWFRTLFGNPTVKFDATLLQGRVRGKIGLSNEEGARQKDLTLTLICEDLLVQEAAAAYPAMTRTLQGADLKGKLSTDLKLELPDVLSPGGKWINGKGQLKCELAEAQVTGIKAYGISLPALEGIVLNGAVTMADRKATVDSLSLDSNQFSATLEGALNLAPRFMNSHLNLKGKLKLAGELDAMLGGFLPKKDSEGVQPFSLRGTVRRPIPSL